MNSAPINTGLPLWREAFPQAFPGRSATIPSSVAMEMRVVLHDPRRSVSRPGRAMSRHRQSRDWYWRSRFGLRSTPSALNRVMDAAAAMASKGMDEQNLLAFIPNSGHLAQAAPFVSAPGKRNASMPISPSVLPQVIETTPGFRDRPGRV